MITARRMGLGVLPLVAWLLGCNAILGNAAPEIECSNGLKDGDETGVDCGGAYCPECCEPPCALWAKRFGDGANQFGRSVAADDAGNVLLAGDFLGTIDFGDGPFDAKGGREVYVTKLDPGGAYLWSKGFGDGGTTYVNGIVADATDNMIVAGEFHDTIDFGGGTLTSQDDSDIFLAKLDGSGAHVWSRRFGDVGAQRAWGVTVDRDGNLVVAGSFDGVLDFGGGALLDEGGKQAFVAKLDQNGDHLWSTSFGASVDQDHDAYAVAVDSEANVIVAGWFYGTIDGGCGPLDSLDYDVFVVKLDTNGSCLWSKRFGDASSQWANAVAVDAAGSVVVVGSLSGVVDLGGGALTGAERDAFVVKLDAAGHHLWSKRFGDAEIQDAWSVAVAADGAVLISGYLNGAADFGGGPIVSTGLDDAFLVELDAAGNHLFSRGYGDGASQTGVSLAIDGAGSALFTGDFAGSIDFGSGPLASAGGADVFVAKLSR